MALLAFEGFDAYGTAAQAFQQANLTGGGGNPTITTTNVRTGRAALSLTFTDWIRQGFALSGTTIIIGLGVRWSGVSSFNRPVRTFATANSRSGISFGINASGNLTVGYGGPTSSTYSATGFGTTLWTGTDIEPTGTYLHYELKAVLSSTATGAWTLRRNGQIVQSQSGVITLAGAGDVITALICECPGSPYVMDDLYICDGSTADSNDFLGPVRVQRLSPTGDDSVAWTPNAGGNNWSRVSEAGPDDDTTFVSAASVLTDRYTIGDLPASAAIIRGVRVIYRARKEDAATVETRALLRSGGIDALGPTDALDTTYRYYSAYYPTDPNTGVAWTPAGVNALVAGVRRVT